MRRNGRTVSDEHKTRQQQHLFSSLIRLPLLRFCCLSLHATARGRYDGARYRMCVLGGSSSKDHYFILILYLRSSSGDGSGCEGRITLSLSITPQHLIGLTTITIGSTTQARNDSNVRKIVPASYFVSARQSIYQLYGVLPQRFA